MVGQTDRIPNPHPFILPAVMMSGEHYVRGGTSGLSSEPHVLCMILRLVRDLVIDPANSFRGVLLVATCGYGVFMGGI